MTSICKGFATPGGKPWPKRLWSETYTHQSQESVLTQASFNSYSRLIFETAPNGGTFPASSWSKVQGAGWRDQRLRLREGQVMAGRAVGSGFWDLQASGLSIRSHSWLAHSSALRGDRTGQCFSLGFWANFL